VSGLPQGVEIEFVDQLGSLESLVELTHGASYSEIALTDVPALFEQSPYKVSPALQPEVGRAAHDFSLISIFVPFNPPELFGGRSIQAVVPLGYQPIIDTSVPRLNNYVAGGVVHHNCGKTVTGAFETTCHITGRYPEWWEGYRFDQPVKFWAAGDTAKTVRDIIQVELLGNHNDHGTGMIPGEDIIKTTPKAGVPDAVDTVYVKHYDDHGDQDGVSQLGLKSYDQGRIAFQGTEQDGIWLDEECPMDVYTECLIRTMTTSGLIYLTFTPLKGLTDVVMSFMPKGTEEVFGG
jgi:phage terminase large subunit-like protein